MIPFTERHLRRVLGRSLQSRPTSLEPRTRHSGSTDRADRRAVLIAIIFRSAIVSRRLPSWEGCITSTDLNGRRECGGRAPRRVFAEDNAKLVPHMAHTVTVTGDVSEKDGQMMIAASTLTMIKKYQWSDAPESRGRRSSRRVHSNDMDRLAIL